MLGPGLDHTAPASIHVHESIGRHSAIQYDAGSSAKAFADCDLPVSPRVGQEPALVEGVTDSDDIKYTQQSALLTKEEMDYYVQEYADSGFGACNNFYATVDIDYVNERTLPRKIDHPALYIGAADDHVLKPHLALLMRFSMSNLDKKVIKNAGHWILWEQTEKVNTLLLEWLSRVTSETPTRDLQVKTKRRLCGIAAVVTAVLAGALARKITA